MYLYSLIACITASFKLFIFLLMQTKSYLCTDTVMIIRVGYIRWAYKPYEIYSV